MLCFNPVIYAVFSFAFLSEKMSTEGKFICFRKYQLSESEKEERHSRGDLVEGDHGGNIAPCG
jgi:hypothetical protein